MMVVHVLCVKSNQSFAVCYSKHFNLKPAQINNSLTLQYRSAPVNILHKLKPAAGSLSGSCLVVVVT